MAFRNENTTWKETGFRTGSVKPEQELNLPDTEGSKSNSTTFLDSTPTDRKWSDVNRFIQGLKDLSERCNLHSVTYNAFGITKFEFADGSSAGGMRVWFDSDVIDEKKWREHFDKK